MVRIFRRPAALPLLGLAAITLIFAAFSAMIGATSPVSLPVAVAKPIVAPIEPSTPQTPPGPIFVDATPTADAAAPALPLAMLGVLMSPKPPLLDEDDAALPLEPATAITPSQQPATLRPSPQWSARDMQTTLLQVPEIWLQHPGTTYIPQTGRVRGQSHPLLKVVEARPDLQGLPMRRRSELQLPADEGQAFRDVSVLMRKALSELAGQDRSTNRRLAIRPEVLKGRPDVSARVMHQMLQIESASLRRVLLGHLRQNRDPAATRALAHRAVYEPLADIRQTAASALAGRPVGDFLPVLLDAFSNPWPPAADHAADTLIRLGANEAVPDLIRKLDETAPTTTVRELVRVNHSRNCLLCHAQSVDRSDDIRVAVPSPTKPLPPSFSLDTYEGGGGGGSRSSRGGIPTVFARPDITYFQQEFSWMLPVSNPGPWPALQRFDFIIRTRPAEPQDKADATTPSPQKLAIVRTLRTLTGKELSDQPDQWRTALTATADSR